MLAPYGLSVQFPCLAEDASKGKAAKGVTASVVACNQGRVESMHQNVIPEGGCVMQICRGGSERGGGPGEGKRVRPVNIVGLHHVAPFIQVEPVGRIGGNARRVEHAGGSEG